MTDAIINKRDDSEFRSQYDALLMEEGRYDALTVIQLAAKILDRISLSEFEECSEISLPGNLLQLAAKCFRDANWVPLAKRYIETIDSISHRGIPLTRISPFVLRAFRPIKRGPEEMCKKFLSSIIPWFPRIGMKPTRESTVFFFRLLIFISHQSWLGENIQNSARWLFQNLLFCPRDVGAKEILLSVNRYLEGHAFEFDAQLGLMNDWTTNWPSVNEYLLQASQLYWAEPVRSEFEVYMLNNWLDVPEVRLQLCAQLLRINHLDRLERLFDSLMSEDASFPDPYTLRAIWEIRKDNLDRADKLLHILQELWKESQRGPHPWLISWMHREFAKVTSGRRSVNHLIISYLSRSDRLPKYQEILSERDVM